MGYSTKNNFFFQLFLVSCVCFLLFCVFGDFYASGMQDAVGNKMTAN